MYTIAGKDFDMQQIIEMNGRGNQEPLTTEKTTSNKRIVRDHRTSGNNDSDVVYSKKEKKRELTPGEAKLLEKFKEVIGQGDNDKEEEVEEESPNPNEDQPEKKD